MRVQWYNGNEIDHQVAELQCMYSIKETINEALKDRDKPTIHDRSIAECYIYIYMQLADADTDSVNMSFFIKSKN